MISVISSRQMFGNSVISKGVATTHKNAAKEFKKYLKMI